MLKRTCIILLAALMFTITFSAIVTNAEECSWDERSLISEGILANNFLMVFGSDGEPDLFFDKLYDEDEKLHFATCEEGEWVWDLVDEDSDIEPRCAKMDDSGKYHVFYNLPSDGTLRMASGTEGNWNIVDLGSIEGDVYNPHYFLDGDNSPCIVYDPVTESTLNFTRWNGITWDFYQLTGTSSSMDFIADMDDEQNIHVIQLRQNRTDDKCEIYWGKGTVSTWNVEMIKTEDAFDHPKISAFKAGDDDDCHFTMKAGMDFSSATIPELKYCHWTVEGLDFENIGINVTVDKTSIIEMAPDGTIHVCYLHAEYDFSAMIPKMGGVMNHTWKEGGNWNTEPVFDFGLAPLDYYLYFDPEGNSLMLVEEIMNTNILTRNVTDIIDPGDDDDDVEPSDDDDTGDDDEEPDDDIDVGKKTSLLIPLIILVGSIVIILLVAAIILVFIFVYRKSGDIDEDTEFALEE